MARFLKTVKKHLNIVFIGHVDAGKSTLCGHVLYQAGIVDVRQIEKFQMEATKMGMGSWYLSWVMDLADTERQKGKTEELGVAHFESEIYKYTILDAPGHRTYVPQMIGGAVQADIGVLVASARSGEFEAGFERGGQTSEHLIISKTSGVRFIIVVVNKMDDDTVKWSQKRYNDIVEKLTTFMLKEIGFKKEQFTFIPIAGLTGENLKDKGSNSPWYSGPTLFQCFDQVPLPPRNENDKFVLPVYDRIKSRNIFAYGKIEKGIITEGTQVLVMPSGVKSTVTGIFVEETKIRRGVPGDNIRLVMTNIDTDNINVGSVLCTIGNPCHVADKVIVKMKITKFAPQIIALGFSSMMHIHNEAFPATIEKIITLQTPGQKPEKNARFCKPNDMIDAVIQFSKSICVETFADFPQLGRFLLRYEGFTIGFGVVKKLPKSKTN